MLSGTAYTRLSEIARAGIERVDPYRMITENCFLRNDTLTVRPPGGDETVINLSEYREIIVIGAGKAAAKMAAAVEEILGSRISEGCIAVKPGHTEQLELIEQIEASHPVPDEKSLRAAERILESARRGDEKTLFINLISGGGSALLASPRPGITLENQQLVTKSLLESGATIQEINCIRKHLSGIKGGMLARALYPARSVNLVLSDVVGDPLDSIASGPCVPDRTTFADAGGIISAYGLEKDLPRQVVELIRRGAAGEIEETPNPGEPCFGRTTHILLGTNSAAVDAALKKAGELGFNPFGLGSYIIGEAREAAKLFLALGKGVKRGSVAIGKPACVIGGGETTVTIRGGGLGGRNQEFALAFSLECGIAPDDSEGIYLLSAATDGNDGPTDSAGGFGSLEIFRNAEKLGLRAREYLTRNDAYRFLEKADAHFMTGPTNTNVCDLYILLIQ